MDDIIGEDGIIDMIEVIILQLITSQYVILCSRKFLTENIVKIAFSFPFIFSSLRILILMSTSTKELYKYCLCLNTSRVLSLSEI